MSFSDHERKAEALALAVMGDSATFVEGASTGEKIDVIFGQIEVAIEDGESTAFYDVIQAPVIVYSSGDVIEVDGTGERYRLGRVIDKSEHSLKIEVIKI